jgi:hypothetical protein
MSDVNDSGEVGLGRLNSLSLETIHHEVPSHIALATIARVMEALRVGVTNPGRVRLDTGVNQITIKISSEIVLIAKKPNGNDNWVVQADHQIRKMVHPDHTPFYY